MNPFEKARLLAVLIMLASLAHATVNEEKKARETIPGIQFPSLESVFLTRWLNYGFLLEVEGFYGQSAGESASDLLLATVEFTVGGQVTTNIGFHVGLLWEQYDREDQNWDEAYFILGRSEDIPLYLKGGKMYLPFGNFESTFITDPLTLELGEINKSAVAVGFDTGVFNLSATAFRGIVRDGTTEPEDKVSDGVIAAHIALGSVRTGVYWISDLMETDGQVAIGKDAADQPGFEHIGGAGGFVSLALGSVSLNAEYISALDAHTMGGASYTPMAYSVEASVLLQERWTLGVRYEGSDDLYSTYDRPTLGLGDKYAGKQAGAVVSLVVNDILTISGEYLYATELDDNADADVISLQLSLAL